MAISDTVYMFYMVEAVIFCIYIPAIILTNIVVILAIVYVKKLHSPDNYMIVNFAVADFLVGAVALPIYIVSYTPGLMQLASSPLLVCYFMTALRTLPQDTSFYALVLLCSDRFFAINFPIRYQRSCSSKITLTVIIMSWLVVTTEYSTILFVMSYNETDPADRRCNYYEIIPYWYRQYVIAVFQSFCLCVCLLMCLQTISIVVRQTRQMKSETIHMDSHQKRKFRNHVICVKIMSVLTLVFIILWMPTMWNQIITHNFGLQPSSRIYHAVARLLRLSNSWINAPVYAYCRKVNRRAYLFFLTTWPWHWKEANHVVRRDDSSMAYSYTPSRVNTPQLLNQDIGDSFICDQFDSHHQMQLHQHERLSVVFRPTVSSDDQTA